MSPVGSRAPKLPPLLERYPLRTWTSLSAGLIALGFVHVASASPQHVTLTGRFPTNATTLEAKARDVLVKALPSAATAELPQLRTVKLSSGERVVKMAQHHRGIPVVQRGVAVTIAKDGVARQIASKLEQDLPADTTPAVTKAKAAQAAKERTGLSVEADAPVLTIWPTADGNKLAWAVAPTPLPGVPYAPVVVVDAKTGEVLLHYNAVRHLSEAKMYPSNPVASPDLVDITVPVADDSDVLENDLVVAKNCIDNKTVKKINMGGFSLDVHICDLEHTAVRLEDGSFNYEPAEDTAPEDEFAELSIFWHANRAYEYFRTFDPELDINGGKPMTTVANLRIPQGFNGFDLDKIKDPELPLQPFSNAFFTPADPLFGTIFGVNGGALYFGQGPRKDFAYDGDVVYHELTHAVVNATLKLVGTPHMDEFGASMAPGAMNEALSDYFAAALTGDPKVGEHASQDIAAGRDAIRTLDTQDACPTAITGEVHGDASLFSGGLWDVRKTLEEDAQYAFDRAIFTAMNSSASGDLGYEDVANLILEAVKEESELGETVADALSAAFTTHGVLPRCDRIIEHPGGELSGSPEMQGLWMALGTQTTGAKTSGSGGWTPGIVQFRHALPEHSEKLSVEFSEVNIGGGGGGGSPFGGGGTPFTPKLLVRFDEPITFTYKPLAGAEDMLVVDLTKDGMKHSAEIEIPEGATAAYVMIANSGQSDGAYTKVALDVEVGEAPEEPDAGTEDPEDPAAEPDAEEGVKGGCGCEVPGSTGNAGKAGLVAGALAVGLAFVRRRKKA